ncbi:MAG TPA: hypothetical protein VLH12_11095, partial [Usitatibacter sp.]|nr:hypothetical protein [Usitatibacter sp.]
MSPAADAAFATARVSAGAPRLRVHWSDRVGNAILVVVGIALAVFLLAPMAMILAKSVEDRAGDFVGLANFEAYFRTPALLTSIW